MSTADRVLAALQAGYKLKAEGPGKYRCNSPLRSGSNSHAFTLTIDDGEHGAYCDHKTNEHGSLYDLAAKLNIQRPAPTPHSEQSYNPSSATAYANLADYCQQRGWPLAAFHAAGWKDTNDHGRRAISFPVATGTRYRFIDGGEGKYKSAPGVKHCLYGLDKARAIAEAQPQPLVLCNGEASTIVAQHYGVAAFCVAGGEGSSIEKFIDQLPPDVQYLVALDCDNAGRTNAPKHLAALHAAGRAARAVDLNGGDKFDLADFATLNQAGTAAALLDLHDLAPHSEQAPRMSRLIRADDLHTLPPTRWLVEGVIGTNKLHQLFAPGGSGKSFLALDMALCVAQHAPVVYIAGEAIEDYHPRVEAWKQFHQGSAANLVFWNGPVVLRDPGDVQAFITAVQLLRPALIVLDPLAACMVGLEESSTGDMTTAIDALNTIRTATSAAVFVIHHTGWGTEHERGSSSLRAACRMVMKLTNDDGLLKLTCEKANSTQGFEPRYFRLLGKDGGTPVPVPASRVLDTSSKLSQRQLEILETLSLLQFLHSGASHSQIVDHTGMAKGTANKAISKLMLRRLIEANDGRFKVYKITALGEEALAGAAEQSTADMANNEPLGVNWVVNTDVLEVHQGGEQLVNNTVNYGEQGAAYQDPSSPIVHPLQAQVHHSSPEVHHESEPKFTSSPVPPSLEGEQVNNEGEQQKSARMPVDTIRIIPSRHRVTLDAPSTIPSPSPTDVRVVKRYIDLTADDHIYQLHEAARYMQERPELDWHVQKENLLRARREYNDWKAEQVVMQAQEAEEIPW